MNYQESILCRNFLSNFKHFNLDITEEKLESLKMLIDKYNSICYICKEISDNIVNIKNIKSPLF